MRRETCIRELEALHKLYMTYSVFDLKFDWLSIARWPHKLPASTKLKCDTLPLGPALGLLYTELMDIDRGPKECYIIVDMKTQDLVTPLAPISTSSHLIGS
jgi:hypothetical protein